MAKKRAAKPIKNKQTVLDIQDWLLVNCNRKEEGIRNQILFLVGVTTGYRTGDLVNLKVRDIKEALKNKEFIIFEGKKEKGKKISAKNRKPREVELLPSVAKVLKDYIAGRNDYEYVFLSRKGTNKNIGVEAISKKFKKAGKYFGLDNITAHSMRKTYAYKIYKDNGNDILLVKEMLCHTSIEQTKKYLGLEKEKYHEASKSLEDFVR